MAQVDFSNAVLDVYYDNPMAMGSNMGLYSNRYLFNIDGIPISQNYSSQKLIDTPTKVSVLYSGEFMSDGSEFYIGNTYGSGRGGTWKVSNISFRAGDSYAFVVDIDISGNT